MHANLDSGKKRPLLPASRKEAEVLQGLLDKNLPPGSITMKVQHSMFQPESAAGVSLVDLTVLEREFKLVDSVQRAASEQARGGPAFPPRELSLGNEALQPMSYSTQPDAA